MTDRQRRASSPLFSRTFSAMGIPGKEGQHIKPGSCEGRAVGVFCSGGDSQGMNSAVRAVVRMGYYLGCKIFYIKEGYQGMVDGGEYIVEATWASSSNIIQLGGTIIGSARCADFRKREGRLKAAFNLVINSIADLVCIGGDGSLTGANLFRKEWPDLMSQLLKDGKIDQQQYDKCCHLNIVGLVGSIDNDFCGTDMTIGADSALHRIVECVDAISATASSHQRAFVMEVMGRHCGYLALVGAMATESDWVFIPEWPPLDGWEDVLCKKLAAERATGQRLNIIIVSEGAIDRKGNPITATQVKDLIATRLKYDTRVTVLGHVQRGGMPSAYDRILAARMGAEAVLALMDATPDTPACVISSEGNQMVRVPLVEGVEKTQLVQKAMDEKNFDDAVKNRGRSFQHNLQTYRLLSKLQPPKTLDAAEFKKNKKFAIINIGAPACGVNAVVRSFVRLSLANGYIVLGINDSFEGLLHDRVQPMSWMEVQGWSGIGGSRLGTKKVLASMYGIDKIAAKLEHYDICGLLMVGGFEAYQSALQLSEARDKFKALCIPLIVIPCTISNNVPGTAFSLGADTAVNEITHLCDRIKQSASGTKRRVFVVETMGGYCGYLATVSGLAAGADASYIFEEPFTISDLKNDVTHLKDKIVTAGVQRGLVLRNELSNVNYTTDFMHQLFAEEGKGVMSCRKTVLGYIQQGGVPSPFDRIFGSKMAAKAVSAMMELVTSNLHPDGKVYTNDPKSALLLGMGKKHLEFTPLSELKAVTDFEHRLPTDQWYLKLRPLLRILAKHKESLYVTESKIVQHVVDLEEQTEF